MNHVFFNFHEAALADAKNKDADAKRYLDLLPKKAVSTESAEDRATAAMVAKKNVAALEAQKDYKIIRAPLAGTITARFVDVGALIQNAGNSQAAATPVVTVSHVDRLKVYTYADQKREKKWNREMKAAIPDTLGGKGVEPFARQEISIGRLPEVNR